MRLIEFSKKHLFEQIQKENTGFSLRDLIAIYEAHVSDNWIILDEGKKNKNRNISSAQTSSNRPISVKPDSENVVLKIADLFNETSKEKFQKYPSLENKVKSFIEIKKQNPIQPFGSSDKLFSPDGIFTRLVPGLRHAHMTHDISIIYMITGKNPTYLKLYALVTHDESGTGQPPNINKQRNLATKISNQNI